MRKPDGIMSDVSKTILGEGEDPIPEDLEEDVELANLGMEDYATRLSEMEED